MLVAAYGFPGISFIETLEILQRLNLSYNAVSNEVFTFKSSKELPFKLVVFRSLSSFIFKKSKLETTDYKVVAIVIDNIEVLKNTNLLLQGYESNTFVTFADAEILKLVESNCRNKQSVFEFIKRPTPSIFAKLINKYNADSVVQEIQTSFYRIKNVDTRAVVSNAVKELILSKTTYKKCFEKCNKVCNEKEMLAVFQHLKTPETKKLIAAIKEVDSIKNVRLEKIARSYNISPFDIRYFLSKK
jgi:hypothetical protein